MLSEKEDAEKYHHTSIEFHTPFAEKYDNQEGVIFILSKTLVQE